jgi:hypothetical protein
MRIFGRLTYYLIALVAILRLVGDAQACSGCGCRGSPGYRGPDGRCVGYANLKSVCGDPPETRCAREGAPKVEEPECSGCGCKGGPGYRAQDGHCVGWQEIGRLCGSPPTIRCKAEGPNAGAEAAAKSELKQIESLKPKAGTK